MVRALNTLLCGPDGGREGSQLGLKITIDKCEIGGGLVLGPRFTFHEWKEIRNSSVIQQRCILLNHVHGVSAAVAVESPSEYWPIQFFRIGYQGSPVRILRLSAF